ncbi:MAG: translation initiation factor IF-2 [Clostridiaceae bacterium]|nr:translation initiation factor IF-2 [Clostridiaceae bacterium]
MVKKDNSGETLNKSKAKAEDKKTKSTSSTNKLNDEKNDKVAAEATHENEEAAGPTITMQGVSGKKITGVVKVVKVNKAAKKAPEEQKTESEDSKESAEKIEEKAAEPVVEKKKTTKAKATADSDKTTPAAVSEPAETPAKAQPVKTATVKAEQAKTAVDEPKEEPAAKPEVAEKKADAHPVKPAKKTEPAAKPPIRPQQGKYLENQGAENKGRPPVRPQSGNYVRSQPGERLDRPHGDRPLNSYSSDRPQQGQYGYRPQGGGQYNDNRPQGGGQYNNNRPQGGGQYNNNRPQGGGQFNNNRPQGSGPYNSRPQGQGGPQGARPYGNRPPQGGARPGGWNNAGGGFGGGFNKDKDDDDQNNGARSQSRKPKKTGPAGELRDVLPQAKATNFAARDAFDKNNKRDDKREPKKTFSNPAAVTKDKHQTLKKQAAELSGQGVDALNDEKILETIYKDPVKGRGRGRGNRRNQQRASSTPAVKAVLTHVKLPDNLTVKEFAEAIKKTSAEVIKRLMKMGVMATLNQEIDFDTAEILAGEFGITCEKLIEVTEEDILFDDTDDDEKDLQPRPPVVVVMGHVDHGKTSILDHIRSASVASGEAGGITQHIGAYTVRVSGGRQITFLDTPGHEAFTTMRARGAQVTDIAILVVAADDGVMPQTIEAINHARAAKTEIIVAINKIDKEGANIDRVKQELSKYELIPEEWGGQTVMVPVSALSGKNMDELLEMVQLTADVMELKANPDKQAKGTVIEAKLDKNRGPVATVLVQRGTLRTGDTIVSGSIIGHVRAMTDDKGNQVKKAGPSVPVEILGMPEVPEAGDIFYAVTDERVARSLADKRRSQQRESQLKASSRMSLDTLFSQMAAGEVKDLNLIVKADVQGSVEAVKQSLEKLNESEDKEVRVRIIHGAVGAITEYDIRLAEVSNAIVIGFNVRPAANVADLAKEVGVDLRMYRVIYNAIEDIQAAMKGLLTPQFEEHVLGHAKVRQIFKVSGVGTIAGCYVTDGKILRSSDVRIVRDGIVINEGKLSSLKRFKDDAREVSTGYECGIGIERFNDLKENDVIEAFEMREIERS